MLIGSSDIVSLHERGINNVTEEELKKILGRYNMAQALLCFGTTSKLIFECWNGNKITEFEVIGIGGIRNPATGSHITQFGLAYLANIILISRANDWRSKQVVQLGKNNLEILSDIYQSCLRSHEFKGIEQNLEEKIKNAKSTLIKLYQEQLSLQFYFIDVIARNYVIFCKIAGKNKSYELLDLKFQELNGISIEDYFYIGLAIFSIIITKQAAFKTSQLTESAGTVNQGKLTKEKVTAFLNIKSADYFKIREIDNAKNVNPSEWNTKTRYNPLNQKPIIKVQRPIGDKNYVVPNYPLFVKSVFDLFWYFDEYFASVSKTEQMNFRTLFGEMLEDYVEKILKHIYGEDKIKGEIKYKTAKGEIKFLDFYVEVGDRVYVFEVKANRFRLPTLQDGLESDLIDDEIKKFTKPILQVKDRFNDINVYRELEYLRGKKLIPFVIFFDIPFVNDSEFYNEILAKTDDGKMVIDTIEELGINCCNINEFEKYAEHSDSISLEEVFSELRKNPKRDGVVSISVRHPHNLRELFFTKEFDDFKKNIMKITDSSYEEIKQLTNSI